MNKKKQPRLDVSGLTVQDILEMDYATINKLSTQNLKALSQRLISASNKRLKRIEKSNLTDFSKPYKQVKTKGKGHRFSNRGKNRQQTLKQFQKMKQFLNRQTGSVSGIRKTQRDFNRRMGTQVAKSNLKKFWQIYRQFEESNLYITKSKQGNSLSVQEFLAMEIRHDKNEDSLLEKLNRFAEEMYEEQIREDVDDFPFFDIDKD